MAVLGAAFPAYPATAETVALYAELLADVPWTAGQAAVRDLLMTSERWPSPATIRKRAAELSGLGSPTATEAWAEVSKAAREAGRHTAVVWSHPAIQEAVKAIGWWEICSTTNPEALRAQFRRMYEEIVEKAEQSVLRDDIGWLSAKRQLELEP
jgi:hypothetical protein